MLLLCLLTGQVMLNYLKIKLYNCLVSCSYRQKSYVPPLDLREITGDNHEDLHRGKPRKHHHDLDQLDVLQYHGHTRYKPRYFDDRKAMSEYIPREMPRLNSASKNSLKSEILEGVKDLRGWNRHEEFRSRFIQPRNEFVTYV